MCTVVVEVPSSDTGTVRLLAVRDEDPNRPWDPPGVWWPERPSVIGVRDRRAGGAWMAADPEAARLSVILNRADVWSEGLPAGPNGLESRGSLVLDAVAARELPDPPRTAGFNLVTISAGRVMVTSWDGETLRKSRLAPGVHMVAHHDVDDPRSARIAAWLPEFRKLAGQGAGWRAAWIELLARSAQLPAGDDRAIIRDNRGHGYPTLSLLVCTAEIALSSDSGGDASEETPRARVRLESATLAEPAVWGSPLFREA